MSLNGRSNSDVSEASLSHPPLGGFFSLKSEPSGVTTRSGTAVQEWAWAGGNQEHGACVLATVTTPDGSTSFGVRRAPIDRPKSIVQNSMPSTCYAGPGIPPPSLTDLSPGRTRKGHRLFIQARSKRSRAFSLFAKDFAVASQRRVVPAAFSLATSSKKDDSREGRCTVQDSTDITS